MIDRYWSSFPMSYHQLISLFSLTVTSTFFTTHFKCANSWSVDFLLLFSFNKLPVRVLLNLYTISWPMRFPLPLSMLYILTAVRYDLYSDNWSVRLHVANFIRWQLISTFTPWQLIRTFYSLKADQYVLYANSWSVRFIRQQLISTFYTLTADQYVYTLAADQNVLYANSWSVPLRHGNLATDHNVS